MEELKQIEADFIVALKSGNFEDRLLVVANNAWGRGGKVVNADSYEEAWKIRCELNDENTHVDIRYKGVSVSDLADKNLIIFKKTYIIRFSQNSWDKCYANTYPWNLSKEELECSSCSKYSWDEIHE